MDSIVLADIAGGKIFCDFFGFVLPMDATLYAGAERNLKVKTVKVGKIKILAVRSFKAFQIRDIICALETGDSNVKLFSRKLSMHHGAIKPDDDLIHVAVKYVDKDYEALDSLGTEWWNSQRLNT